MNWLTVALFALVVASWASTVLLFRAALLRPRIGALTERAVIALIISAFGTVCAFLVMNTETGGSLLALDAARVVFRLLLLGFLLVPVYWLWLYATNRLGHRQ